MAQKENASDVIGGVLKGSTRRDLNSILMDLRSTQTINESLYAGGAILGELARVNRIQSSRPQQAGFAVLKSPNFPSVLVELAFITNPLEEKFLKSEEFQIRTTKAIVNAVQKYKSMLVLKDDGDKPQIPQDMKNRFGG